MKESNQNEIAQFHKNMLRSFSLDELRTLCFEIRVNYDILGGEGLGGKSRELIIWMAQNGRLPRLQNAVEEKRPHIDWPDIREARLPNDWKPKKTGTTVSIGGDAIGSVVGDGSVTAENIAGRDVIVNKNILLRNGILAAGLITVLVIIILFFVASRLFKQPVEVVNPVEFIIPTNTPTPIPSVTPWPFDPALDGEILIIISKFAISDGLVDTKIEEEIELAINEKLKEINGLNVRVGLEPTILDVDNEDEARALGENYNASLIIFGENTGARITIKYLDLKNPQHISTNSGITDITNSQIGSPANFVEFVTEDLPNQLEVVSLLVIGQSYWNDGAYDESISIFNLALDIDSGNSHIYNNRGGCLFQFRQTRTGHC